MAFQVKELLFVLSPSEPHLACGAISADTQCPTASATQPWTEERFDCGYTADTACGSTSCAYDSARLDAAPGSEGSLQQLRRQLAEIQERGEISLN